ncbi:4143_t:CDS:10 [Diversispora eburnea]|uniref:4143_t:CDS:1 n=1 Tax=Diversispora eburnea TaxID=1213867 RepID=A0A9N8UZR8_9GLOM|nr:4143_t:CDS:10 [Diversispora eburnea]
MERDQAFEIEQLNEEKERNNESEEILQEDNSKIEFKVPAPINPQTRPHSQQSISTSSIPYKQPEWSSKPKDDFALEVIKSGISIEIVNISSKEFLLLGRLPVCDIPMEHPSISRYHAVIQFNDKGQVFIYDLESAHGTKLNKQRILPLKYNRLRVGDQIKFGESTRTYVLLGPEEEEESSSRQRQRQEVLKSVPLEKQPNIAEVTWGMVEDAEEEGEFGDLTVSAAKESWKRDENAYYYKDSKKALRNWFENRGYDMEFENEQEDVEDAYGPVYGIGSGPKKRDAERQAAIDACEKLDMLGILRGAQDEILARKKRLKHLLGNNEDEDNDSFYDRTGQADRVKLKKSQQTPQKVETYESLTKQYDENVSQIDELQIKLSKFKKSEKSSDLQDEIQDEDALESYMKSLNNEIKDESEADLLAKLKELLNQKERLSRLIKITKPPEFMKNNNSLSMNQEELSQIKDYKNSTKIEEIEISKSLDHKVLDKETTILESSPEHIPSKRINNVDNMDDNKSENIDTKKKKIKSMIPMTPKEYEEKQRKAIESNEFEVEDATTWEPPQGQTGDGRTILNEKFGY